jgi:putative transposase
LYPENGLQTICDAFGITRQAHYKQLHRSNELAMQQAVIIKMVESVRKDMPRIGGRKLFFMLQESFLDHKIDIGRDKFFNILSRYGFLIRKKKRRRPITTDSDHPFYKYPNLIKDMKVLYPNHLWVSDITYISLINKFAYLSLITDVYSRKIVGYCLWQNLSAQGPLNALQMALEHRKIKSALVHHSDRGLQYCSREYIKQLSDNGIAISMTENGDPYENALAERINGILKSEFDLYKTFKGFELAREWIDQAIEIYNNKRPHSSCDYLTPNQAFQSTGNLKNKWKKEKTIFVNQYQD